MVKNPGVSLFPITFISRLRFHAHSIGGLLQPRPQFRSLWSEGQEQGREPRFSGLLREIHEDPWGSRGTVPRGDGH